MGNLADDACIYISKLGASEKVARLLCTCTTPQEVTIGNTPCIIPVLFVKETANTVRALNMWTGINQGQVLCYLLCYLLYFRNTTCPIIINITLNMLFGHAIFPSSILCSNCLCGISAGNHRQYSASSSIIFSNWIWRSSTKRRDKLCTCISTCGNLKDRHTSGADICMVGGWQEAACHYDILRDSYWLIATVIFGLLCRRITPPPNISFLQTRQIDYWTIIPNTINRGKLATTDGICFISFQSNGWLHG